jgi:hypothetical protein
MLQERIYKRAAATPATARRRPPARWVLALPVNGTVPFFGGIGYPVVGAAVPYEVWTVVTGGQYAPPKLSRQQKGSSWKEKCLKISTYLGRREQQWWEPQLA